MKAEKRSINQPLNLSKETNNSSYSKQSAAEMFTLSNSSSIGFTIQENPPAPDFKPMSNNSSRRNSIHKDTSKSPPRNFYSRLPTFSNEEFENRFVQEKAQQIYNSPMKLGVPEKKSLEQNTKTPDYGLNRNKSLNSKHSEQLHKYKILVPPIINSIPLDKLNLVIKAAVVIQRYIRKFQRKNFSKAKSQESKYKKNFYLINSENEVLKTKNENTFANLLKDLQFIGSSRRNNSFSGRNSEGQNENILPNKSSQDLNFQESPLKKEKNQNHASITEENNTISWGEILERVEDIEIHKNLIRENSQSIAQNYKKLFKMKQQLEATQKIVEDFQKNVLSRSKEGAIMIEYGKAFSKVINELEGICLSISESSNRIDRNLLRLPTRKIANATFLKSEISNEPYTEIRESMEFIKLEDEILELQKKLKKASEQEANLMIRLDVANKDIIKLKSEKINEKINLQREKEKDYFDKTISELVNIVEGYKKEYGELTPDSKNSLVTKLRYVEDLFTREKERSKKLEEKLNQLIQDREKEKSTLEAYIKSMHDLKKINQDLKEQIIQADADKKKVQIGVQYITEKLAETDKKTQAIEHHSSNIAQIAATKTPEKETSYGANKKLTQLHKEKEILENKFLKMQLEKENLKKKYENKIKEIEEGMKKDQELISKISNEKDALKKEIEMNRTLIQNLKEQKAFVDAALVKKQDQISIKQQIKTNSNPINEHHVNEVDGDLDELEGMRVKSSHRSLQNSEKSIKKDELEGSDKVKSSKTSSKLSESHVSSVSSQQNSQEKSRSRSQSGSDIRSGSQSQSSHASSENATASDYLLSREGSFYTIEYVLPGEHEKPFAQIANHSSDIDKFRSILNDGRRK